MGEPLLEVTLLTLRVSLSATLIATLIGLPAGAFLAAASKRVRAFATPILSALMGLPPVVVGLGVYLLLSRSGPLGGLGVLYTPTAMVIAQSLLVIPIVTVLTKEHVEEFLLANAEQLRSMGARNLGIIFTALFQVRFTLTTVVLAGAGRAFAEVGAVLMVGGNIEGETRVLTTTIATETGKGELTLALWFGGLLMVIVLAANLAATMLRRRASRRYGL